MSNKDQVRFLAGDTSTVTSYVEDEEITWALGQENSNVYRAAALVCESIGAKQSAEPDVKIGDLALSGSQTSQDFMDKAKQLRSRSILRGVSPFVGGIGIADKDARESDSDRVVPGIRIGMHDYDSSTGST
jgi:hypothetical protein